MTGLEFDTADARLAHAAWSRIAEPGDRDAGRLIASLGAPAALDWLVRAATASAAAGGQGVAAAIARWRPRLDALSPQRELEQIERLGGRLLIRGDPGWPAQLEDLADGAPHCLWVRGALATGGLADAVARSIAIVGTRAATAYGEYLAGELAADLVARGFAIVSGGAFGIDAAAHRAAIASGGRTISVQAGGLDRAYPAGNAELLARVAEDGALVSEVPPGSAPHKFRFLQRNRVIAALGQATVVVEAAWRSGAQNTARHAAELLRPVGAMPGPVTSAASAGCHRLIRDGAAVLVSDAAEVVELAGALADAGGEPLFADKEELSGVDRRAFDAVPMRGSVGADALMRTSGLAASQLLGALGRLELAGLVANHEGRWGRTAS